jgi:hypothetical protein
MRAIALVALVACTARVDGPSDDHAARDRAAAVELAAHLTALPGIARASAIVHTPFADPLAPPAPAAARTTASIAIAIAPGMDAARVSRDARTLATAALGADSADVTIAVEAAPDAPALATVGPFTVAARDRGALTATLVAALAIIAALAAWIAAMQLRQRRRGMRPQ